MDAQGVTLDPNIIKEGESQTSDSTPTVVPSKTPAQTFDEFLKMPGVIDSDVEDVLKEKPMFTFDSNGVPIFNNSVNGQRANVGISQGGALFNNDSTKM